MVLFNQLPSCFVVSNPEDIPNFAVVCKRKFPFMCFFCINELPWSCPQHNSFFSVFFPLSSLFSSQRWESSGGENMGGKGVILKQDRQLLIEWVPQQGLVIPGKHRQVLLLSAVWLLWKLPNWQNKMGEKSELCVPWVRVGLLVIPCNYTSFMRI